jgi:hypothetical protein
MSSSEQADHSGMPALQRLFLILDGVPEGLSGRSCSSFCDEQPFKLCHQIVDSGEVVGVQMHGGYCGRPSHVAEEIAILIWDSPKNLSLQ